MSASERLVDVIARCDAHVAPHAFGECAAAFVEPAAVERKADDAHHFMRQVALLGYAHLADDRQRRPLGLQFDGFAYQVGQAPDHDLEQLVDIGAQEAGAEAIDERIVRREPERLRQHLRLVARQRDHFFEMRREQREVVVLARLEPTHFCERRGTCKPGDQRERSGDRVVALAAHLTQVGELPVLELRLVRLRALDESRNLGRGEQRVAFGVERGELFAPDVGAAARHHDGGIPAQQARRALEGVEAAEFLLELLVRTLCHDRSRTAWRSLAGAKGPRRARNWNPGSGGDCNKPPARVPGRRLDPPIFL